MAYVQIPTRTSTDANASADINQLQDNFDSFITGTMTTNFAHFNVTGSSIVFNEAGSNVDFRVESDTKTHALFVDGGAGYIGMGRVPSYLLDVYVSDDSAHRVLFRNASDTSSASMTCQISVGGSTALNPKLQFTVTGQTDWSIGIDNADLDKFKISRSAELNTNTLFTINASNQFAIGTTTFDSQSSVISLPSTVGGFMRTMSGSAGIATIGTNRSTLGLVFGFCATPYDAAGYGATTGLWKSTYASSVARALITIGDSGSIRFFNAAAATAAIGDDVTVPMTFMVDSSGNIVCNYAAIATNATNGFLYIPSCAGTPTGTPTAYTGRCAMVFDTTNNKLYVYDGGWVDVT